MLTNTFALFTCLIFLNYMRVFGGIAKPNMDKTWTYYFVETECGSKDDNLLKIEMKVDQVSRGIYGLTGSLLVGVDIDENTEMEALVYRSATGSGAYEILPFSLDRQHIYNFFNSFYKDVIMRSIKDCSNLPQFENEYVGPLEKKLYTLDKCQVSNKDLPDYMQEGFYKVDIKGYGPVEWFLTFIVKVESSY